MKNETVNPSTVKDVRELLEEAVDKGIRGAFASIVDDVTKKMERWSMEKITGQEFKCLQALKDVKWKAVEEMRGRKSLKAKYRVAVLASKKIYRIKGKFFADPNVCMGFIHENRLIKGDYCPLCILTGMTLSCGCILERTETEMILCPLAGSRSCCEEWEDMQFSLARYGDDKTEFLEAFKKLKKRIDSLDEKSLPEKVKRSDIEDEEDD